MTSRDTIHFSDTPQQVLVTGATGFIGQLLVSALREDGQQVTVLTRNPSRAARMFGRDVRCVACMDDLPASYRLDIIINLAGARILGKRWTDARKAILRRSRIGLTQRLVAWIGAAQHKPQLLLSASAIGYYGIQPHGEEAALTEQAPPQPVFMSELCQDWEAAAQAASAYGVHVRCMRFGLVLGQQGALPMLLLPVKLGFGGPLGGGRQWLSWIHVSDVLRGMAHLCQHNVPHRAEAPAPDTRDDGAYNFTAPGGVTQRAFSKSAAAHLHRPSFFPTPGFPIRLVLGEQADLLLEGQRVYPQRLLESGFVFRYPTLEQALASLI